MTLPLNSRLSALYDTNGTQKDFSFGFRVFFDPDNGGYGLEVRRQTADGYEVIPKSDYLVLPVEDNSSGVVRFSVAPSAGQQIYIAGKTPTIQQLVLTNFGRYSAESIETQFDFITAIIQEWLSALSEETRQRIANDSLVKAYSDSKNDELKSYLESVIREQGLSLDQINENYEDLIQRLNQIAINKGWITSLVIDASGYSQQQINDLGGSYWYEKQYGYDINSRVLLDNGDIVKSIIDGNTNDPNLNMAGWVNTSHASQIIDLSGLNQQEVNDLKADNKDVLPTTQTKDSFKNAYSTKLTSRFNRIKDQCSVSKSYVWKNPKYNDDIGYRFSLGLNMNGYNTIEWDFVADIDNFWRMRYGFTGSIRSPSITMDATNLSQSPNRSGDNSYFRSTDGLNASFDVVFTGTGFLFNHYVDDNGGLFEVRVDGGDPLLVSTHASNPENSIAVASNVSKLIINGLASVEHTATFKFIGDDPLYPPTSGTSRGWFKLSDGVQPEAFTAYVITGSEMGIAATGSRLVSNGILEFAIGAAAVGSDMTPDWIPAHGSASGCIVVSERKLFVDGIEYLGFSNTEMAFNEFTMRQKYTAYNSSDTSKLYPMWSGVLYTKFDKQRGLTYNHEFTTLREIYVQDGYTAMTSGRRTSDLSKMTFDNGFVLDISGSTPASQIVHYPGVFKSVSWTGSKTALALSIESIEASAAIGTAFTDGNTSVLTERNDGFCKVYAKPLGTNKTIPAGVTISSTHKIWLAAF